MVEIEKKTLILDRYSVEKKIGSGGFGTVYLVFDIIENKPKALKKLSECNDQKEYVNEIEILLNLQKNPSPYVIKYYDHFIWEHSNVIVTEYYSNGDLGEKIKEFKSKKSTLFDEKFDLWVIQMTRGLYFLHQNNIIHRDIKPQNIFLTQLGDIVIGDLGIAKYNKTTTYMSAVGTIYYSSPEIILEEKYNFKTDMWSLGCVIYELKTHEILFYGPNNFSIMNQILSKEISLPDIKNKIIAFLLEKCLIRNQNERIDSNEAQRLLVDVIKKPDISPTGSSLGSIAIHEKPIISKKSKCLRVLEGHLQLVNKLIVLSTGELVSCSLKSKDNKIRIWNTNTGKCLRVLEGHLHWINDLTIMPNEKLASCSTDETIRIWDTKTGKCLKVLKGHTWEVDNLTVLSSGELVSGSSNDTIRIWNAETGQCLRVLKGHEDSVNCLAVLSSGELVSGSADKTIRIWNTKTGQCLRVLKGHLDDIDSLKILPTGKLVSVSDDKTIRVWDAEKGICLRIIKFKEDSYITILPTGKLATFLEDEKIRIWNAETGVCLRVLEGHKDDVQCLTVLLTGELVSGSADNTIRIWNAETGECLRVLEGHSNGIFCLEVLPTGELVSGSFDTTIRIWDA